MGKHNAHVTAPPACGNVAFAQEGENTSSSISRGSTHNAVVCMARSIQMYTAMSARHTLDYTATANIHRPLPVPIPTIETDITGNHLFDTTQYVSIVIPISHPLAEQDHTFAAIRNPSTNSEAVITEGILPALDICFNLLLDGYHGCITCFCEFVCAYLSCCLMHSNNGMVTPITVTCRHANLCITFYPVSHEMPILIRDHNALYIVPERAIPGNWIDDDSTTSPTEMGEAFPATATRNSQANSVHKKDPSVDIIGDPCDLANFLPDSRATQHMTLCRADIFDMVQG
jgi:hypothetical protein